MLKIKKINHNNYEVIMEKTNYFKALYSLVTVINSSLSPSDVYAKIVEQVAKTMNCKASTMRLLDLRGTMLLSTASYGLSVGYMRKGPVEVAKSGLDIEVLTGKTIYLEDATSDGRFQYPESAKKEGLISVVSVPLILENKTIGLLRVYSDTKRAFSGDEIEFLEAVAAVSAIAINNACLYEQIQLDNKLQKDYIYQVFED